MPQRVVGAVREPDAIGDENVVVDVRLESAAVRGVLSGDAVEG